MFKSELKFNPKLDSTMVTPTERIYCTKVTKNESVDINHVSVKLPRLTAFRPSGYFLRAESQFELAKINQEKTKYNYLLSAIPKVILHKISDFLFIKCLESDIPDKELKSVLLKQCLGSKKQLTSDFVRLIRISDNIEVSEIESRSWDLINEIC
uniref:DUF7041 domain-containing protein n=1 Tax=Lepeophtheirus salmonis TaxID=72036 RepID=A0A0K2U3K5_LEPSM